MGLKPPYFLLLDNHRSHMSIDISELCEKNGIHLIGLHPNATHIQQPLDLGLFHPFKVAWDKIISAAEIQVKRSNVCALVGTVFQANYFGEDAKGGFRSSGLFPLNRLAIDESKLIKKTSNPRSVYAFGASLPLYVTKNNAENQEASQPNDALTSNNQGKERAVFLADEFNQQETKSTGSKMNSINRFQDEFNQQETEALT